MAQLPKPVRAYIGLWARAVSEARELPRRVVDFPVLAASTTARATLRMGQQYADLVNRGDDVLTRMRGTSDQPPTWARFDEDEPDGATADTTSVLQPSVARGPVRGPRQRTLSAFDRVSDTDLDDAGDTDLDGR